ncbi:hypothetical protein KC356_g8697 [Hortaea werneckii]|nr:hypothetical protein KC356_g8697 [Hortaea werneckii]
MQLQKNLWLLAGLAALSYAQDDSECDPQNDDNNNATCTSSSMGTMTSSMGTMTSSMGTMTSSPAAQSTTRSTTDSNGNPLIVTVPVETNVNTNVISSTSSVDSNIATNLVPITSVVGTSTRTTLVPESLATRSTIIPISTNVIRSTSTYVTETLSDSTRSGGAMTMSTSTSTGGSGGAAGADSQSSSSSSSSDSGAMPTGAPKYALGGVAAAVFGLAAL